MDQDTRLDYMVKLEDMTLADLRGAAAELERDVPEAERELRSQSKAGLAEKMLDAVAAGRFTLAELDAALAMHTDPVTRVQLPKETAAAAPVEAPDAELDAAPVEQTADRAPERIVQILGHGRLFHRGDVIADPVCSLSGMMYRQLTADQARAELAKGNRLRADLSRNPEYKP